MAKPTLKDLKAEADEIYQQYDVGFAGKARATRDLDLLDGLIERLAAMVEEAKGLLNGSRDPALMSVLDMAKSNLAVYKQERAAIEEAKAGGPQTAAAADLVTRANMAFARYHRNFAGKDRGTRPVGMLDEIIADLKEVQAQMKMLSLTLGDKSLKANLEIVEQNIRVYTGERQNILQARHSGTLPERGDVLANAANEQFRLYREHFAGKPRSSRRAGLIERILNDLRNIQSDMKKLQAQGNHTEANTRNLGIVKQNLEMYAGEHREIVKARASMTSEDVAGNLGAAANQVMAEYREHFAGQDRRTRDLTLISTLCDQLGELAKQMRELEAAEPALELNTKNLRIVLDTLMMYETEYRRIEEAKAE